MFTMTPTLVIAAIQILKLLIECGDLSERVGKTSKKQTEETTRRS